MTTPAGAGRHQADATAARRHADATADEDTAAVLVVLAALAAARPVEPRTVAPRSVWGRPPGAWAAGADAWWASGLPR